MTVQSTFIVPAARPPTTHSSQLPKTNYPGDFTFIIRDIDTPPKAKAFKDDAAIFTHVARIRQTWKQKKRKAFLHDSTHTEKKTSETKVVSLFSLNPLFLVLHQDFRQYPTLQYR